MAILASDTLNLQLKYSTPGPDSFTSKSTQHLKKKELRQQKQWWKDFWKISPPNKLWENWQKWFFKI